MTETDTKSPARALAWRNIPIREQHQCRNYSCDAECKLTGLEDFTFIGIGDYDPRIWTENDRQYILGPMSWSFLIRRYELKSRIH